MRNLSDHTLSLCPHCLRKIPARKVTEGDSVFLEKSCPEHGDLGKTLIWRNRPRSYSEWGRPGPPPQPPPDHCPYGCDACNEHGQNTCSAILEVTHHCNLECPVCFADSGRDACADPDIGYLSRVLRNLVERRGPQPIQLSGGEPTLRDDIPHIVALSRRIGFDHIQINTNGIRLALDPDYARSLKDAGATTVFLQFDGVTDDVYRRIRGAELLALKLEAVARCAELKLGVILVPTLVRNVNEHQVGAIIRFAAQWIPTVKGVHFQPMTYLGRYPDAPRNEDRILIPDILEAIENQTDGELKVENFIPPG